MPFSRFLPKDLLLSTHPLGIVQGDSDVSSIHRSVDFANIDTFLRVRTILLNRDILQRGKYEYLLNVAIDHFIASACGFGIALSAEMCTEYKFVYAVNRD